MMFARSLVLDLVVSRLDPTPNLEQGLTLSLSLSLSAIDSSVRAIL